jgi:hypothetical protein
MLAAVQVLAALPGPRWLVLGDMGEVGSHGPQFHAEVGQAARAAGIEHVWSTGPLCAHLGVGRHFQDMAALLAAGLTARGATLLHPVQANMIFAQWPAGTSQRLRAAGRPAQPGANPGQQLRGAEGLRDIVVRTRIERRHLLGFHRSRRQDHDRHRRPLPQPTDQGDAVLIRQPEVEEQQVGLVRARLDLAPPVAVPPAVANGYVTFGSANHPSKFSRRTFALWAAALRAVPTARLRLKSARRYDDPAMREELAARFAGLGVAPERLIFDRGDLGMAAHLGQMLQEMFGNGEEKPPVKTAASWREDFERNLANGNAYGETHMSA